MGKNDSKVATMKVMKAEEQPAITEMSIEERQSLISALQKEIDDRTAEMNTKFYIVEGNVARGEQLIKFLTEKAQWKFTEAIGVVEAVKEITEAVNKAKARNGQLFLQILPLEALWFFINKVEGVGLAEADYYQSNLVKPIGEALSRVKNDRDSINQLMMRQGALEAGADFEQEAAPVINEMAPQD